MTIPMLCCSPDFTHPDPDFRRRQVEHEQHWIEMAAALGAKFCRVLSGQRRPEVSRADGIRYAAECIEACLPAAERAGVTLDHRESLQRQLLAVSRIRPADGRVLRIDRARSIRRISA